MNNISLPQAASYFPHKFAKYASDGKFDPYEFQQHISRRIVYHISQAKKNKEVRILVVNAPPQHGKSEFISKWVPLWYLTHNPD